MLLQRRHGGKVFVNLVAGSAYLIDCFLYMVEQGQALQTCGQGKAIFFTSAGKGGLKKSKGREGKQSSKHPETEQSRR